MIKLHIPLESLDTIFFYIFSILLSSFRYTLIFFYYQLYSSNFVHYLIRFHEVKYCRYKYCLLIVCEKKNKKQNRQIFVHFQGDIQINVEARYHCCAQIDRTVDLRSSQGLTIGFLCILSVTWNGTLYMMQATGLIIYKGI